MDSIVNNEKPEKLVYTVKEIAEMLDVSLRTAYNMCNNSDDFKVIKLTPKSIRVHKESFDQWFSSL